jgi:hypothetical protein
MCGMPSLIKQVPQDVLDVWPANIRNRKDKQNVKRSYSESVAALNYTLCSVGTYQDEAGKNSCKDYGTGEYSAIDEPTKCELCRSGT